MVDETTDSDEELPDTPIEPGERRVRPRRRAQIIATDLNFDKVIEDIGQHRKLLMGEALHGTTRGAITSTEIDDAENDFLVSTLAAARVDYSLKIDKATSKPYRNPNLGDSVEYADRALEAVTPRREYINAIARQLAGGSEWKRGDDPQHGYFGRLREANEIVEKVTAYINDMVKRPPLTDKTQKFYDVLTHVVNNRNHLVGENNVTAYPDALKKLALAERDYVVTMMADQVVAIPPGEKAMAEGAYKATLVDFMQKAHETGVKKRPEKFKYDVAADLLIRDIKDIATGKIGRTAA